MPRPVTVGNGCGGAAFGAPSWVYHRLPRSSLTERIPLVILVWSACGLPTVTTTSDVPDDPFWLVWILLPIPTKSRIWVCPCRAVPLPIRTSADRGLGDTEHIVASRGHQGTGWCGSCGVTAVDDVAQRGEPRRTLDVGQDGAGRYRKENFQIIRPVGMLF